MEETQCIVHGSGFQQKKKNRKEISLLFLSFSLALDCLISLSSSLLFWQVC